MAEERKEFPPPGVAEALREHRAFMRKMKYGALSAAELAAFLGITWEAFEGAEAWYEKLGEIGLGMVLFHLMCKHWTLAAAEKFPRKRRV